MTKFRYFHPIQIRYADIDAQGHVNNAKFLTFMELARVGYLVELGLWDGFTYEDSGIILASASLEFKAPIRLNQNIQVGVRVSRIGQKSMNTEYILEDSQTGQQMASGVAVMVAYDYRTQRSIPVPPAWRERIAAFEQWTSPEGE